MKFQTKEAKWHEDGGGVWLALRMPDRVSAMQAAQEVREKLFDVEIKEHSKRRSLDANAYCWVLLDKLSAVLSLPKIELYRSFIKDVGGNCDVVCVQDQAVTKLCNGWEHNGLGWMTEVMESKIEGCSNVILYYGSSTYDSAQMARLIQSVVDACHEQEIETMGPDELCKLKGLLDG